MYEDIYGLTARPFQLTPDPRFWVETATHRKAMAYLGYGMAQGEGFIVITGDIGAGKTTLVGHLLETIDATHLHVVKIVSTQVEPEDLLRTVAEGMGVPTTGLVKADLLKAIERQLHAFARSAKRTLLIVDEVQALPTASLEELRMLSNFQAAGHALLQILLLGQPEFRGRVADPGLEQLRQRIIATHHLTGMGADEVELYVAHRLTVAGWQGKPDFDAGSLAALHDWSGGIPRRINQLATRVLLHGAMEGITAFTAADIRAVIADLEGREPDAADLPLLLDTPLPVAEPAPPPHVELPTASESREIAAEPAAPNHAVAAPNPEPIVTAEIAPLPPEAAEISIDDDGEDPPAMEDTSTSSVVEPDFSQWFADRASKPEPAARDEGEALTARIASLESRLEEQDAALRRVLTLMVDWIEGAGDRRPDLGKLRDSAA